MWARPEPGSVATEHSRLADPGTAERRKAFWRERLEELRRLLEK